MDTVRKYASHIKGYFIKEDLEEPRFNVNKPLYVLKKGDYLPENAELIDLSKVYRIHNKRLQDQKNLMDTWALKYGTKFCGLSSCIIGLAITKHFRTLFNLGKFGVGVTYLPSTILPNAMSMFYGEHTVDFEVMTDTQGDCHACFAVKAGLAQCALGYFYPFLSAYFTCNFAAVKYSTFNVARMMDIKGNFYQFIRMCPRRNLILMGILSQIFVGMEIAQKKVDQFEIFMQDIHKNDYHNDVQLEV